MATIEMKVPITFEIPVETVSKCIQVLEWWLNEDKDRDIYCDIVNTVEGEYRKLTVHSRAEMLARTKEFNGFCSRAERRTNE